MTNQEFENWVEGFLIKRFPSGSSKDSGIWRKEVLKRYYKFGEEFELPYEELYSRATFGLWFLGGQK